VASPPAIDAARVIADLRELDGRTGGSGGARRVCWGPVWSEARDFLRELLAEVGVEQDVDEAGNLWARLPGSNREAPAVGVGSHIDSVPGGGWLDGALGVMAAIGALRAWADAGERPSRDLVLIDFADEEGSRFGRSLFGSSALAGTLDPDEVRGLRDADGNAIAAVLAEVGVDLDRAADAHRRLTGLGAWLELHIEQGPVLEVEGRSCAAVTGTAGVERHRLVFSGQAAHAGTTPMDARRDAGLAAAQAGLAIERIARERGGVGTTGLLHLEPGIVTAVAGRAELGVDLRHPDAGPLEEMLSEVLAAAARGADERRCVLGGEPIWRIAPIPFDGELVELASRVVASRERGRPEPMPSGALHDAAEIARRIPAAMIFVASRGGISHAVEEDSSEEDLTDGIEAFGELVARVLAG
jgi:hydantoinase/carbamoylase family amidase